MENTQTDSLISIFSALEDPRIERTKRHNLTDIIAIAICAVVCGADSWVDMEVFGKSRKGVYVKSCGKSRPGYSLIRRLWQPPRSAEVRPVFRLRTSLHPSTVSSGFSLHTAVSISHSAY